MVYGAWLVSLVITRKGDQPRDQPSSYPRNPDAMDSGSFIGTRNIAAVWPLGTAGVPEP